MVVSMFRAQSVGAVFSLSRCLVGTISTML